MALRKENYETIYGANAEHWVIESINNNTKYGYADITLLGYLNKEAYESDKTALETKKVKVAYTNGYETTFSKRALVENTKNIYQVAYEYLKENSDFFKDAIDC